MKRLFAGYAVLRGLKDKKGYTIVEVMIVISVSAILFASAVTVLAGKQNTTEFDQAVYDMQSKIQNIGSQVSSGSLNGQENYSCSVDSSSSPARAVLTAGGSGGGGNQDCLILGQALVMATNGDSLYNYTVVGNRTVWSGTPPTDTGNPVSDVPSSNPTIANDPSGAPSGNPGYVLNGTYQIPGGATVGNSTVTDFSGTQSSNYYMVGIYASPAGGASSSSQGTAAVEMAGYPFNGDSSAIGTSALNDCVHGLAPCTTYTRVKKWDLCLNNAGSSKAATLETTNSVNGLSVKVTFGSSCS